MEQQYLIDVDIMNEAGTNDAKIYEAYVAGNEKILTQLSIDLFLFCQLSKRKRYSCFKKIKI